MIFQMIQMFISRFMKNFQGAIVLNVSVEYAVFAPGQYAGNDISGGSDYIYAYQK